MKARQDLLEVIAEGCGKTLTWNGRIIWKNPVDLVIYQEIAREVEPTLVIETGTHFGGAAEFWFDMMRGKGRVVTIDIEQRCSWKGKRKAIMALEGSSTSPEIFSAVEIAIRKDDRVLVNLDSAHHYEHVTAELASYHHFVTPGSYLIVEDGIDDIRHRRAGARQACLDWLPDHPNFVADAKHERTGLTNCPDGFLKRLK
jgi:cephalosporin hydroxylase